MKVKIITYIPTDERVRPVEGGIYKVIREIKREYGGNLYFIECNGESVGVFAHECMVMPSAISAIRSKGSKRKRREYVR